MRNEDTRQLAVALLHADEESDVVSILRDHKLWDDTSVWRLYGDRDSNYATIGNQQSRPEAALVEKIVNSVDARLMNECLVRKIDPESPQAPTSLREAVAQFIEGRSLRGEAEGLLSEWPRKLIQEQEAYITLAVTGNKPPEAPCITLVDLGEGQTPARVPDTFLSIDRSNKLRIPFVQGKFNMGGTGALKFCGTHNLQLIITRRNPTIVKQWGSTSKWGSDDPRADEWSVTVVRRERPSGGAGDVRNSVYRFLAPVGADKAPTKGHVLSFHADCIRAMPEHNKPYARDIEYGSVIKLYNYDVKGFGSHALQPDGLLSRTELLLPEIALPVRIHECRAYRGDPGRSFANTLVGVIARLRDNPNLEKGYPSSVPITVRKERMTAHIYAFQGDKADSYRKNEGVIFTINGQTHGSLPKTFFDRARVKMGRLAKSLVVVVDCSALSVAAREDLFMNSRDRLSNGELRKAVEEELEDAIGHHPGLRELRERRRNEEIEERLQDSKPLEDVLESILKSSPTLSRLFLLGQRLSRPHRADPANTRGGGPGGDRGKGAFKGRPHPTYFRFFGEKDGVTLMRGAELGRRCRIRFETDADNDYFERRTSPGHYHVAVIDGPEQLEGYELDHNLLLFEGVANWSINIPDDRVSAGDEITLECTVTDDTLAEPFVNIAKIRILDRQRRPGGEGHRKQRNGGGQPGETGTGLDGKGGKGLQPGMGGAGGLVLPPIIEVKESDENWKRHSFDETTACKVIDDSEEGKPRFVFYVNVDNLFLRTEMKGSNADVALVRKKFIWSNVLIGLALIHDQRLRGKARAGATSNEEPPVTEQIDRVTKALAPFMVPMIDYLGALTEEESFALAQKGDDD